MTRFGYIDVDGILVPAWSEVGRAAIARRQNVEMQNQEWVGRLAPLVFGHYGWREGEVRTIESAGTGIFVAPRFALSARHVSRSYELLDDQFDAARRRSTYLDPKHVRKLVNKTKYSTLVYQLPYGYARPGDAMGPLEWPSPDAADSHVLVDLSSDHTDITTLQTEPTSSGALQVEKTQKFFEWQMLPPPVGAQVRIFGLPGTTILNHGDKHTVAFNVHGDVARVLSVSPVVQDCGFAKFPGFRLDREFEHGMSGAAVFYEDALVGIFSGPDYVAALWPLAIHSYVDVNLKELQMSDLFDSGAIRVRDWAAVNGRVEHVPCEEAGIEDPCSKEHVILR